MNLPSFILASASPARRRLLEIAGIKPLVCQSNFDESQIELTEAAQLVQKLALCKAEVVAENFTDGLILGCDSVLEIGGEIYGKPENAEVAIARWQKMSGNTGILYTGHALIDRLQQRKIVHCGKTKVTFAQISDREISAYVASGEPLKCAGAFALEGKGGLFVESIEGCHSNIIGLSLPLLRRMLAELGYNVTDFWQS
ncbi:Maf family protein [Oscillatoria salina]|uniref:Maf family protein n=1 Tax=Oscillatoria salina TaxID=331517 RepID=UPI0013B76AF7|nr:nucleoside triphosphate pyrophosphatase [Oscillatoria salina]MBZ8181840.1 septum formation inhibitor Maf [Oscillatoria salina IIICB1]NET87060.1 septum formation inhibitor Maf [Kamptonema sp. SIO1D9]